MTLEDDLKLSESVKSRYVTRSKIGAKKNWHPEHELFYLSEKILDWYYNHELGFVIIHGQQGYGKSTYACISCAEVYGHDKKNKRFFYDWEAIKNHIVCQLLNKFSKSDLR